MAEDKDLYDFFGSDFNSTKYFEGDKVVVGPAQKVTYFVDGSDAYANLNKLFISFQHVPTEKSVFFKAFITAFNEAYNCDWSSETVYGRADPIYMFKQTQRKITLAFKIPAASTSEAYENLGKVQQLVQFLYPSYSEVDNATTISQSPLVRMKVMNLLRNTNDRFNEMDKNYGYSALESADVTATGDELVDYSGLQTWQSHDGLLGVIDNLAVNHNLEGDDGAFVVGSNALLPKFIDLNLTFSPIHEHPLGWDENGIFAGDEDRTTGTGASKTLQQRLWPYGVKLKDPLELYSENSTAIDEALLLGSSNTDVREASEAAIANAAAAEAGLLSGLRAKITERKLEKAAEKAAEAATEVFESEEYAAAMAALEDL
ncbi:hypothetical protein CMI47_21355 [Candidatus Pacearchaeota archaeon]|nr:hypothetical protein [Candidatus Pacearchaeota archaeon]|tara:strand:- start:5952 stop:7070 length:1119 start_codon:yes stop_codon:yes gene_type:complete